MSKNKSEKQQIEGRVAQIINARELVINIGFAKGVRPKMKFAVLAEHPIEVHDPDTGEVLDFIDREKVRVVASEVREKVTICKTYRFKRVGGGALSASLGIGAMAEAFSPPRQIPETLEAKHSSLPPPLSPEDSYVKIKDRVIQVTDTDDE